MNITGNIKKESGVGFTIIELLVVVAIITVLSGIVLVNIVHYTNKGKNTSIKANMETVMKNAVIYYSNSSDGDYRLFPTDPGFTEADNKIKELNGYGWTIWAGKCSADSCPPNIFTGWCYCSPLLADNETPAGFSICVDSIGYKKVTTNSCSLRCRYILETQGTCID